MTPLADVRKDLGLSLEGMARLAGLRSRGHLSQIERGEAPASVSVALNLEALSGQPGLASTICPDVKLVRAHDAADLAHLKASLLEGVVDGSVDDGAEKSEANISGTAEVAA